jgi:hypothetical protein
MYHFATWVPRNVGKLNYSYFISTSYGGGMSTSLSVQIAAGPASDRTELDRLSRELRRELLQLDVDDVVRALDEDAPGAAKAAGNTLIDVLIVSVSNSTVLVAMVQLLSR